MLLLQFVVECGKLLLMMVHLTLQLYNALLEAFSFNSSRILQLLCQFIVLLLHLLLRHLSFILSVLLDEFLLLQLNVSDLLIDVHLLLVEGRFVLHTLVQKYSELIGLMDAVNQNCHQRHFLFVRKLRSKLMRSYTSKFGRDLSYFFVEWSENERIFTLGIQQDQPDDLRPEPFLIINKPVDRS